MRYFLKRLHDFSLKKVNKKKLRKCVIFLVFFLGDGGCGGIGGDDGGGGCDGRKGGREGWGGN